VSRTTSRASAGASIVTPRACGRAALQRLTEQPVLEHDAERLGHVLVAARIEGERAGAEAVADADAADRAAMALQVGADADRVEHPP
jgi:hypothetical protein